MALKDKSPKKQKGAKESYEASKARFLEAENMSNTKADEIAKQAKDKMLSYQKQSLEQLGEAADKTSLKMELLSIKEQAVSTASKVANKATSLLGKGLNALSSPIGVASIAVLGLITNLSQMAEQTEQNNINSLFEDYQEAAEKSNIDLTKFDDLYKQYKKTGDVSDELIKVSEELSESLDIVGGKALINAGNFDELSGAIHKASDESRELTKRNIDRTLAAIDNAEAQHNPFSQDFAQYFQNLPGLDDINQRTGIIYDLFGKDTSGMDSLEKYQAINRELLIAEENIKKYEQELENSKTSEDS